MSDGRVKLHETAEAVIQVDSDRHEIDVCFQLSYRFDGVHREQAIPIERWDKLGWKDNFVRCFKHEGNLTLELTPECMLSMENRLWDEGFKLGAWRARRDLPLSAIRFYEKQRLLKRPRRTEGGFRLFTAQDVQHIHFIRRAQQLGFSLNEIRDLLMLQTGEVAACSHVRDLLKTKLSSVREKLAEIQKLENQLAADLKKCERTLRRGEHARDVCCPVLDEIADADAFAIGKRG